MNAAIVWFRRDLRVDDHHALAAAIEHADPAGLVVPVFVVDPVLWAASGPNRLAYLAGALRALDDELRARGSALIVRHGDPAAAIPALAAEINADVVVHSQDVGVYGRRRDESVAAALGRGGRSLMEAESPWVVPAGTIRTASGDGFKVFSAFLRRWRQHPLPRAVPAPDRLPDVTGIAGERLPDAPTVSARLPAPGPAAARRRLDAFLAGDADTYDAGRNDMGADATSRLSADLRFGCLHPRQVIRRLDGRRADHDRFLSELAWRDFYADVLHHRPDSAYRAWNRDLDGLPVDTGPDADARFEAWRRGRTGYPIVDAGMRQLLAEGWMHNRARMITASFLVKDLHLPWQRGAAWFMAQLVDGDLPSNQHGWQWVAGTGTDAAPYHRIFNPSRQGERFDPGGEYVRRWVPELGDVTDRWIHEPWRSPDGSPAGYPPPIVDHAAERAEALARFRTR